jgi:hypothetical protein
MIEAVVEDGSCGAIVIFSDYRYGNLDLFAQRVDRYGNVLWDPDGVPVCTMTGDQSYPQAVPDGAGGAIIVWEDNRGGPYDIYCQRIGPDGNRQWLLSGSALCTAANDQRYPRIATDGYGGAIVVWDDLRTGAREIYARRIDSTGTPLWDVWGIPVYTGYYYGGSPAAFQTAIASYGDGEVIVAWVDNRDGVSDNNIYYDHISSDGVLSWGYDGLTLCDASGNQYSPVLSRISENRIAAAWVDYRNDTDDLYAKMISSSGSWWGDGIQIGADSISAPNNYCVIGDPVHGITIFWRQYRNYQRDVFVQRLNFFGELEWGPMGVNVSDLDWTEDHLSMVDDGEGGVLLSWELSTALGAEVRAQKIDHTGTAQWENHGKKISVSPDYDREPFIVENGQGGVIMTWHDQNTSLPYQPDLMAQHIDRHGYTGSPEPFIQAVEDVPDDQGGKVEVSWDASYLDPWPYQEITYYSVWKSLSPASAMMLKESGIEYSDLQDIDLYVKSEPGIPSGMVIRRETVGAATYYWELLETQAAQYYEGYSKVVDTDFTSLETAWTWSYYQIAAHAADPLMVWTSQPDSGYSLDNLAPAAPAGLAGEQEYSPEGMDLVWNQNAEPDLSHYLIYRGTDPSFIPSGANMLASAYDTNYFDSGWTWEPGWIYKVSAVDIHDNESGYALLLPDQVTGDDPPTPAHRDYLSQNFPNPFNPSTTIQFGIKESGHVRLSIYSASGRLVTELINGTLPAGDHTETWNGTNSSGQHVSSGVYFYRIEAGEFSTKSKMILLR